MTENEINERELMTVSHNGMEFQVETDRENRFYWEAINNVTWETHTFELLDAVVKPGDVVLDIGSWAGPIGLYAAAKGAEVYCIDPDPIIVEYLTRNIELNPSLNITPCNVAIAAIDGLMPLYARSRYGASSSSLLNRSRDRLSSAQVKTMSLQRFIDEHEISEIALIKMDIEGGEFELLPELKSILEAFKYPPIKVSFHHDHLREEAYQKSSLRHVSRAMIRLENFARFGVFRGKLKQAFKEALQSLSGYRYFYDEQGNEMTHIEAMNAFESFRNGDLMCSPQPLSLGREQKR